MKNLIRAVGAVVALATAPEARAQFALDAKVAYAIPTGSVWAGSPWNPRWPMTKVWTGAIPVEVAGRYRFSPNLSAGVYFQWGPAFVTATGFDQIAGSFGWDMRIGAEIVYAFTPGRSMNPWFGLGTGWEWTQYAGTKAGSAASVTMNGWEYLNVQTGLDFALSKGVGLGPYAAFLGGNYSGIVASGSSTGWGGSVELASRAFHGWFQIGVKGTWNL
jgi:hypothetical protein